VGPQGGGKTRKQAGDAGVKGEREVSKRKWASKKEGKPSPTKSPRCKTKQKTQRKPKRHPPSQGGEARSERGDQDSPGPKSSELKNFAKPQKQRGRSFEKGSGRCEWGGHVKTQPPTEKSKGPWRNLTEIPNTSSGEKKQS